MIFRLLKSISVLSFLGIKRNKAGVGMLTGEHGIEERDAGPPTTTILYPEDRRCELCKHFVGWFPVRTNDQISYNAFGGCMRPDAERIVALPMDECPFWVKPANQAKRHAKE